MKVQILGSGCARCEDLYNNAVAALSRLKDSDTKVEKTADPEVFFRLKVNMTPALVIDDEVVSTGKLLTVDEIETELLKRSGE
ncbi:thioredoxin family protein [Desulfomonile tiedjei]|uniref:Thioredoxin-like fold domain-containing protein n=1 Tax=Desulfomonile tiedjei (strain ATCC 49306 / DSM 6799 / DCB-1) TaxID=706587 RepID=I4C201_DESTA|nr:thioredoxin family protein [Desulfomonile tiedjei]AFM23592.1 hypothetical protein Desti_0869 [Desulfomonile tiedjei DSM 6799]